MVQTDISVTTGQSEGARAKFREQAGHALEIAGDAAQRASRYLQTRNLAEMRGDLDRNAREHPVLAVTIGLGAGFLIGKLMK